MSEVRWGLQTGKYVIHNKVRYKYTLSYTNNLLFTVCTRQMDVMFVLDISGSVDVVFNIIVELTRQIVYGLPMDNGETQVALTVFSDNAQLYFNLNDFQVRNYRRRSASRLEHGNMDTSVERYYLFTQNVLACARIRTPTYNGKLSITE